MTLIKRLLISSTAPKLLIITGKKLKACAIDHEYDAPLPEYSAGREQIDYEESDESSSLGLQLKEEMKEHENAGEHEEVKEAGAPKKEDKARASTLLSKMMTTSLQVKNKSVHIIGVGTKSAYNVAKAAVGGAATLGKKGYVAGKEGAVYVGKKGYEAGKIGYTAGKEGAVFVGK